MNPDPFATAPLFIPDDMAAEFAEDASRQVNESRSGRTPRRGVAATSAASHRTPRTATAGRSFTRQQRLGIITAVSLALTGLGLCVAWWTVLAVEAGGVWTGLSFGGGTAWVLATAVALSYRFGPDTIAAVPREARVAPASAKVGAAALR